jgi:hypothetical protein
MLSRSAIHASGIVVSKRNSRAGSPFRRALYDFLLFKSSVKALRRVLAVQASGAGQKNALE